MSKDDKDVVMNIALTKGSLTPRGLQPQLPNYKAFDRGLYRHL